jgi:hypothetical protein
VTAAIRSESGAVAQVSSRHQVGHC